VLAFDRRGSGPILLLLHGTTSSRQVWAPMLPVLSAAADVIAVDLPGHGESPAGSHSPPGWARALVAFLDEEGIGRVKVAGHSSGGWAGLELAKLGRASHVLALAPAGLWRNRSPILTDLALSANWQLGRAAPRVAAALLRVRAVRALALRPISARPAEVPVETAVAAARVAATTDSFREHFRQTRRIRFTDGRDMSAAVRVIWGANDRIAPAGKSRNVEELPADTIVETWQGCGHMLMWDAPERTVDAIRALLRSG
jgi:pimeloyl-ACP methyl ester carboxylesterase